MDRPIQCFLFRVAEPCGSWQARTHTARRAPSRASLWTPYIPPRTVPAPPARGKGTPAPSTEHSPAADGTPARRHDRPTGRAPSPPPPRAGPDPPPPPPPPPRPPPAPPPP